MFYLVRKHCFMVAVSVLLWQGWSRTQAAEPSAADAGEPPPPPQRISEEDVPVRGANVRMSEVKDPFMLLELLKQKAEADASAGRTSGAASAQSGSGVSVSAGAGVPVLRVVLQSTIYGEHGRAWINGEDLGVGDVIPGADEESPPVLLAIDRTSVVVQWRGKRFRIDLDGTTPVEEESR